MLYTVALFFLIVASSAQAIPQLPIAYALQPSSHSSLANPSVVDNSAVEAQLPAELMRASNFYRNPKTADALAKDSWLTDKEMPVFEREADKIPREQVFKIFKNAGFLHRRR